MTTAQQITRSNRAAPGLFALFVAVLSLAFAVLPMQSTEAAEARSEPAANPQVADAALASSTCDAAGIQSPLDPATFPALGSGEVIRRYDGCMIVGYIAECQTWRDEFGYLIRMCRYYPIVVCSD